MKQNETIQKLTKLLPEQYKFREIKSTNSYVVTLGDKSLSDPKSGIPAFHITIGKLYFSDVITFRYYNRIPLCNAQERKFSKSEIDDLAEFIKKAKEKFFASV